MSKLAHWTDGDELRCRATPWCPEPRASRAAIERHSTGTRARSRRPLRSWRLEARSQSGRNSAAVTDPGRMAIASSQACKPMTQRPPAIRWDRSGAAARQSASGRSSPTRLRASSLHGGAPDAPDDMAAWKAWAAATGSAASTMGRPTTMALAPRAIAAAGPITLF